MRQFEPSAALEQQLTSIMEDHGQSVLHTCFLYLRDVHAAEDAAQDTFLKVYRSLSTFRGDASVKTWVTKIAINTCRDYLRSAWIRKVDRRIQLDRIELVDQDSEPFDDTLTQEILKLPIKQREVIIVYYYSGMTIEQTADLLGISHHAVRHRLKKAKDTLRAELREWYYE